MDINIKTFYGKRNIHKIRVQLTDLLMDVTSKLIIAEDEVLTPYEQHWVYNHQYRLIATSKDKIKEISPLRNFLEEEIHDNQTLLLLPQKNIYFSEVQIGPNIYLENNNSIAVKGGSDDHQMILADTGYKTGRHYSEFIFKTEPAEKSIVVGICLTRNDYYFSLSDPRGFWGFIPSEAKKIGYNDKGVVEKSEYGAVCKIGDSVGILMEFTNKGLDVTFFINKINMGIAYKYLNANQAYYPCAILGFDSSRIHLQSSAVFPDL